MSDRARKKRKSKKPLVTVLLRGLRAAPHASSEGSVLGHCERAALITAIQLAEALDGEAIAMSFGPESLEHRALAVAKRFGCSRTLRIGDPGDDRLDYLGVARIFIAALQHEKKGIVVCGDHSQDLMTGALGPALAELLEVPHLTSIVGIEPNKSDNIVVRRRSDHRLDRFRLAAPFVLCVEHADEAKLLEVAEIERGVLDGDDKSSDQVLSLDEIGLSSEELTHRSELVGEDERVATGRSATILTSASDLVARMAADHLIGG